METISIYGSYAPPSILSRKKLKDVKFGRDGFEVILCRFYGRRKMLDNDNQYFDLKRNKIPVAIHIESLERVLIDLYDKCLRFDVGDLTVLDEMQTCTKREVSEKALNLYY